MFKPILYILYGYRYASKCIKKTGRIHIKLMLIFGCLWKGREGIELWKWRSSGHLPLPIIFYSETVDHILINYFLKEIDRKILEAKVPKCQ